MWRRRGGGGAAKCFMMKMIYKKDQSFGIISNFLEFKTNGPEPRMAHASFMILKSELLHIFLVDPEESKY